MTKADAEKLPFWTEVRVKRDIRDPERVDPVDIPKGTLGRFLRYCRTEASGGGPCMEVRIPTEIYGHPVWFYPRELEVVKCDS